MDTKHRRLTSQVSWRKGPIVAQLVTHIPDCVVHLDHSKKFPHFDRFDGIVFFADVSGFTSLCEKYTMSGTKSGIDQLTKTLNGYIGALVDRILSADGDVLEYAGDAILAVWTVKDKEDLPRAIYRAIKCALSIQRNYSEWETDVGITLKVKIGVSAGEICIHYQGHDEFRHFTATGKAVEDVNVAETFCQSGYIIISPYAWSLCTEKIQKDVIHETVQDGRHVRIWEGFGGHSSGYDIKRTIKPNDAQKEVKTKNLGEKLKKLLQDAEQYSGGSGLMAVGPTCEYGNKYRQSLLVPDDEVLKSRLKLYIVKPVIKKLDDDQPLEYLSEVREVTIMFTNLSLGDRMTHEEMSLVLQESFEIVYGVCTPLNGCLNKIFAFDKDAKALNFLTIFGLPGFKHENDSQHALQAAAQVHAACLQMNHVEAVSIGVTTGATFCGVIGHKHRQEYTVIGRKVNMAARFMMHYPRRVVCDKETFHNCKLSKSQFVEMDDKTLKGLQNVGTVREYIGSGDVATGSQRKYRKFFYPLLSRTREVSTIKRQILWKRDGGRDTPPPGMSDIIIIEGESGMGKTRLLCDVLSYVDADEKMGVFFCQCTMNSKRIPYFTARSLLAEMLKLDMAVHYQEREAALLEMFSHQEITDALFLLNDIFHVKFPVVEDAVYNMRENGILDLTERIIYEASSKWGFMVFAIDDAFYLDKESFTFLVPLCMSAVSTVIMTKRPAKGGGDPFLAECLKGLPKESQKCSIVSISGLAPDCLSALACQMLGVLSIPRLLAEILVTKSNGVPQWCEELLRDMLSDNLLTIVDATEKVLNDTNMVTPSNANLLGIQSQQDGERDDLSDSSSSSRGSLKSNVPKACVIDPLNVERIKSIQIPESVKALILSRIDQMNPTDQLTVKCASILGESFQPGLLEAIIPSKAKKETQISVMRLIKSIVFACGARVDKNLNDERGPGIPVENRCFCTNNPKKQADFSSCKTLVFTSATMQETACEILLEDQKVLLHRLAAMYLETKALKCKYCGGGDIIPYRSTAMGMSDTNQPTEEEKEKLFASGELVSRTQHTQSMKTRGRRRSNLDGGSASSLTASRLFANVRVAPIQEGEEEEDETKIEATPKPQQQKTEKSLGAKLKTADQKTRRKSCIQEFLGLPQTENKAVISDEEENNVLSDFEQRECECSLVLRYVYPELTRHWKCAGDARNTIYALCHAAAAEIAVTQVTQGLAYLEEVQKIIDCLKNDENPFEKYVSKVQNSNISKNAHAVFYMFKGQALSQMGKSGPAEQSFRKALKLWSRSQPTNGLTYAIKIGVEKFKQRINRSSSGQPTKAKHDNQSSEQDPESQPIVTNDILRCLYSLYQIHMINQQFKRAFSVALQQLNIVEKSMPTLSSLVSAYTCIIEVSTALNRKQLATTVMNMALNRINDFLNELTPDDILSISCLHSIAMQSFLNEGRLDEACDAGQNVIRITQRIHAPEVVLHVLPSLAEALILRMENVGSVRVLKNIQVIAEELRDKIGFAWYYVGSVNLVLYTGHMVEDPEDCNNFFMDSWNHPTLNPEKILKFHIAITMCLWYTRTGSILKAESWYSRAEEVMPSMESFCTFMGGLAYSKVVECQLLRLSQFSTASSRPDLIEWRVQLKDVMKTFTKICQQIEVLQPRKLHLEAFAHGINGNEKSMKSCLAASIAKADQFNAIYDKNWALHDLEIWMSEDGKQMQVPFWQRRWGRDVTLDKVREDEDEEVDTNVNILFTLPLPEWFSQECLFDSDVAS